MNKKTLTLKEIADLTHSKLVGDPNYIICNISDLENATDQDASFLSNSLYREAMLKSRAGVTFIDHETAYLENRNYLISDQPSQSFQILVDTFFPQKKHPSGFHGIHPTAVIHDTAKIGKNVTIGPHAVIDEGCVVGDNTFIGASTYIGPGCQIGSDCILHPRVTIRNESILGNRVIIQPGAVIGSCGFGYITDKKGIHTKLNQVGNVIIEDDVEIGANTTIDRSRFKSTIIGKGSKLDNLIQIGHGAIIGAYNLIVAQTGIAGSTTTGKYVVLAGQVAVAGHLHIGDGVIVAGKSGVTKSLTSGKYGGFPAVPLTEYHRTSVYLKNIQNYVNQMKSLENRLLVLEAHLKE